MPLIIDRQLTENQWLFVQPDEEQPLRDLMSGHEQVVVPYRCLEEALQLTLDAMGPQILGVQINGDDDISQLESKLPQLSLIAIEFPVFRDGRGYSLAQHVRRLGFQRELRAVGQFGRDQLGYMQRCGFNAFELADEGFDIEALTAFDEISVHYQGAVDDPRPIYRQDIAL